VVCPTGGEKLREEKIHGRKEEAAENYPHRKLLVCFVEGLPI